MLDILLLPSVLHFLAVCCGCVAAATDLRTRRIPNWLTLPAMLTGLLLHLATGGWKGGASSLAALLLCGAVFFLFFAAGGMGAGDVKLVAAEASLLGLSGAVPLLVYTALAGGVMAIVIALKNGQLLQTCSNARTLVVHHRHHGLKPHPDLNVQQSNTLRLPYAVAIASGCWLTVCLQIGWAQ